MTVLLTVAAGAALAASSSATEVGVVARTEAAVDLQRDRALEDVHEQRSLVVARARGDVATGRWFLAVQAEHELLLGRQGTDGTAAGRDVEAAALVAAGESGWDGQVGPLHLRMGHLVERWGTLDLLPVADVLNGRDLRAGPLTPPEQLRVPTPMAKLSAGGAGLRFAVLLLPVVPADRARLAGSDWSLLRQGMVHALLDEAQTWEGDALSAAFYQEALGSAQAALAGMDSSTRAALGAASAEAGRPAPLPTHAEVAARLDHHGSAVDVALMAGWLHSRSPAITLDPALTVYLQQERLPTTVEQASLLEAVSSPSTPEWPRNAVVAGEVGTILGTVGLRAEVAYSSAAVVPRQWLQATTSPTVAAGVAADWAWRTTVVLLVEASWSHMLAPPADPLLMHPDQVQVAGVLRLALASERLHIEPAVVHDLAFGETLLRPALRYRASDAIELSLAALWLQGPKAPPETFADAMGYEGGPMSYWGDNDCATFALSWIR